jgi:FkbM family methyltransferase
MSLEEVKKEFENKKIDKWEYIDKMYSIHRILFDYADFISNTNISQIKIKDHQVIMTFRDSEVQFICAKNDKRIAPFDVLNFDNYERAELLMQMELIDGDDTVLDIGGNYGWYALHIAKKFPNCSILSFEPIPSTFQHLNENIRLNNLSNIQTLNFGLSDAPGSFKFYYNPELSVNASLANVSGSDYVEEITCEVRTLDEYCTSTGLKVDFIKCDVEGAELLAFKGAKATIQKDCPVIFSEMLRKWTAKFNYHPNDIISFLSELGYNCYVLYEGQLKNFDVVDDRTIETNYFFLHKEKHADKIKKWCL